jgi:hypothetical protein
MLRFTKYLAGFGRFLARRLRGMARRLDPDPPAIAYIEEWVATIPVPNPHQLPEPANKGSYMAVVRRCQTLASHFAPRQNRDSTLTEAEAVALVSILTSTGNLLERALGPTKKEPASNG